MNYFRLLLCSLFLAATVSAAPFDTADAVAAHAPGSVFTQGEPLRFSLKPYAASPLKWTLRDWQNRELRSGDWPGAGKAELTLAALPDGYYILTVESPEAAFDGFRSFAVVPDPATRRRNPDTFFAMDSAQSWLARPDSANVRHPGDAYELVSEVIRRGGIDVVRERMSWAECEAVPGKFDWKQYKLNADLLSRRGVGISGMYHNAPRWAKTNTTHLPGDLVAVYRFARKAAETFKGQMTDWEFWNEQDIGFAPESAWDYASALKAAYLGFKAADPALPVAIGGYAMTPIAEYADVVMANGAKDYFDIFNIHAYRPISSYAQIMEDIRNYLKRHDIADRPVWFTENGTDSEGSGRIPSYIAGLKAHSPEQVLLVAELLPKIMIHMQSLGVDRDFFFVLPPYSERDGNKDWGLMRRDFTVKPGYVAFSTLSHQLGDAEYLGTVALADGVSGFLYRRPDGSQSLVYWSVSPLETESNRPDRKFDDLLERPFRLAAAPGSYRGIELFGTPFEVKTSGNTLELTATRLPAILTGLSGLKPTVPFRRLSRPGTAESGYDRSIVFRTELSKDFVLSGGKSSVDVKKDDAAFKLQIFNLSDRAKRGTLALSGGRFGGVPAEVTVPPFGKTELNLTFTPELDKEFRGALRVGGTFDGKPASELVAPVRVVGKLLDGSRKVDLVGMSDPVNFRHNSSGRQTITYDPEAQGLKFHTLFPPNVDRWVYPEYMLQLPQESLKDALGIAFEVKVSAPKQVKQMLLMTVLGKEKEHGESINLNVVAPTAQWEERIVQFPDSLDPDRIRQLRLGLNSLVDDITYWVRNVRILYRN